MISIGSSGAASRKAEPQGRARIRNSAAGVQTDLGINSGLRLYTPPDPPAGRAAARHSSTLPSQPSRSEVGQRGSTCRMITRLFVSATGTSAGKTFVTRGLTAALVRAGVRVASVKPLETGCQPEALDALALARAARRPELAHEPSFYRVGPPVSPYAATLGGAGAPNFDWMVRRMHELATEHERLVVEGAGGLLVPVDRDRDMTHLALALASPVLLVAPNRLGVLSHALATVEAATARRLPLAGLVLTEPDSAPDPSSASNVQILRERLSLPIFSFPNCTDDNDALADAAAGAGLLGLML